MYALLASHPRLSMIRRANMWRWFYGKFGDLSDPRNVDDAIDALTRYKRLAPLEADWGAGPPRVRRRASHLWPAVRPPPPPPRRAHRTGALGRQVAAHRVLRKPSLRRVPGCPGDPDGAGPADRYAVHRQPVRASSKGIASATGRWLASVRAGEANQSRYPDRYAVVRFEDLLEDPVEVTSQTCAFIGEAFDPEMMKMSGAPEHSHGTAPSEIWPPRASPPHRWAATAPSCARPTSPSSSWSPGDPCVATGTPSTPSTCTAPNACASRLSPPTADSCRLAYWSLHQRRHQTEERPPATRLVDAE